MYVVIGIYFCFYFDLLDFDRFVVVALAFLFVGLLFSCCDCQAMSSTSCFHSFFFSCFHQYILTYVSSCCYFLATKSDLV